MPHKPLFALRALVFGEASTTLIFGGISVPCSLGKHNNNNNNNIIVIAYFVIVVIVAAVFHIASKRTTQVLPTFLYPAITWQFLL